MTSITQIIRGVCLGFLMTQTADAQVEPEIWRCGNLLTNQPSTQSVDGVRAKCQLLNGTRASVTLAGNPPNPNSSVNNGVMGNAVKTDKLSHLGETQTEPYQPSSQGQMSKAILLNEKAQIISRQTLLEERLRSPALSSTERKETEAELRRNYADLNGLAREIAKLP